MFFALKVATALIFDQLFGDPQGFPHPVRLLGWLCRRCEEFFRGLLCSRKLAGFCSVGAVMLATVLSVGVLLQTAQTLSPVLADFIAIILLYTSIAAKDLIIHSRKVYDCLLAEDLDAARQAVAMIVGRDTQNLDRAGVGRACVETIAENMVDGVTSPVFFAILASMFAPVSGFGDIELAAFGAMIYRAINTMDSMFGYKNESYLEFGWTAARLDDIANFIPARVSALAVIFSSFILRLDWKGAIRIFSRDRLQHSSPNSAQTESAVAGALGIQLGGDASYFGKTTSKPTIGDRSRDVCKEDILRTGTLMQVGTFFFVILCLVLKGLF